MRIIVKSTLKKFWEQPQYSDSKAQYRNASICTNNRVAFNIGGNTKAYCLMRNFLALNSHLILMIKTMIFTKELFKSGISFRLLPALVFSLLIIGWSQNTAAADIQASVDRNPVSFDESFQIIFTATESPDDDPNFSPLEQNFTILSQNNSTSSSWINGKSTKTIQWIVNVMAKETGSIVIPAVRFGKDTSQALTILVTDNAVKKQANTDEELYIDVEATPQSPFIQSQVFYTLRLFTRVDISQARLNEPELPDAVIERLGEDNNYTTQVKGVSYTVTERKYAIFPQKSGKLTIKPLVLTAEVLVNNPGRINPFFNSQMSKTKRVESKAVTLDVKPVPVAFTGKHWLSAEQLVIKESWSGDAQQMKVGEPLTRTLTLLAKGTTVGQLPELNTNQTSEQLKIYPDQPVLQEQKKPDGLLSVREEKTAIIPSKAGNYALPAIEIPWFNTQTQKMEIARISATKISATAVAGQTEPAAITPSTTPAPQQINSVTAVQQSPQPTSQETSVWQWISVFLGLGWLTTLIILFRKRAPKKQVIEEDPTEVSLKEAIKHLKVACKQNDPLAAKNALLIWGKLKFNSHTLGSLAEFCDARLRDEILHLNQTLYGKAVGQWQGKKLFQTFTEYKALKKITSPTEDKSLEPLYRL